MVFLSRMNASLHHAIRHGTRHEAGHNGFARARVEGHQARMRSWNACDRGLQDLLCPRHSLTSPQGGNTHSVQWFTSLSQWQMPPTLLGEEPPTPRDELPTSHWGECSASHRVACQAHPAQRGSGQGANRPRLSRDRTSPSSTASLSLAVTQWGRACGGTA